jgi:hypothetical protein
VIIFGSVRFGFYQKKVTKPKFFKKSKTKTGSNRLVSVRFLGQKPVQTGLDLFFGWLGLFSVWVWFFQFQAYKTETEPVGFFKILIDFF